MENSPYSPLPNREDFFYLRTSFFSNFRFKKVRKKEEERIFFFLKEHRVDEMKIPSLKGKFKMGAFNQQRESRRSLVVKDRQVEKIVKKMEFISLEVEDKEKRKLFPFFLLSYFQKIPSLQKRIQNSLEKHFGEKEEDFSFPIISKNKLNEKKWAEIPIEKKKEIIRFSACKLFLQKELSEKDWLHLPGNREMSEFFRSYLSKKRLMVCQQNPEKKEKIDLLNLQIAKVLTESVHALPKKWQNHPDIYSISFLEKLIEQEKKSSSKKALKAHLELLIDLQSINPQAIGEKKTGLSKMQIIALSDEECIQNLISCKLQVKVLLDVARGLRFLQKAKLLHLDLARRNIVVTLMGNELQAQIIDYDFLQKPGCGHEKMNLFPLAWIAPEVLKGGRLHPKTDLWSFGILAKEIFSLGEIPYPGFDSLHIAFQVLNEGQRIVKVNQEKILKSMEKWVLEATFNDWEAAVQTLQQCFSLNPDDRPEIDDLIQSLKNLYIGIIS